MKYASPKEIPAQGIKGLQQHWKNDLNAAFSVSLVALPLSLGIALASGVPPMSGILASIIGGVVTSIYRGGYISINGPAAGLIATIYTAVIALDDGSGKSLNYLMAAILICGLIQLLLGLFKMGKFAEIYPSAVITGILTAVGIIIFGKQIHLTFGTQSEADTIIGALLEIPTSIVSLNPFVTIIAAVSLLVLVFHPKIQYRIIQFLPAPIWVLILSISLVYVFNFFEPRNLNFLGHIYEVGPQYLIQLPDNISDSIISPDFSRINSGIFWGAVVSITLIATIETLAISKAVEKLDPYQRPTDLNKELIGLGLANICCGLLGGLPVITLIVRSSINVNNGAKTSWSNVFYGVLLALIILLLAPFISNIPLAALAAILIFTAYKLASPAVFKRIYKRGIEQLIFLCGTVIITLFTDLLWGIFGGIALTIVVQTMRSGMPFFQFFKMIFKPEHQLERQENDQYVLRLKGVVNFLSILQLKQLLQSIPSKGKLTINMSETNLVDSTVLEYLSTFGQKWQEKAGQFSIIGLEKHQSSTDHPLALKVKQVPFLG